MIHVSYPFARVLGFLAGCRFLLRLFFRRPSSLRLRCLFFCLYYEERRGESCKEEGKEEVREEEETAHEPFY